MTAHDSLLPPPERTWRVMRASGRNRHEPLDVVIAGWRETAARMRACNSNTGAAWLEQCADLAEREGDR